MRVELEVDEIVGSEVADGFSSLEAVEIDGVRAY